MGYQLRCSPVSTLLGVVLVGVCVGSTSVESGFRNCAGYANTRVASTAANIYCWIIKPIERYITNVGGE
jgi:hypothetical protein